MEYNHQFSAPIRVVAAGAISFMRAEEDTRRPREHRSHQPATDPELPALIPARVAPQQTLLILCSPLMVAWISQTFELQIADQHLPASILWSGHSCRYGQGLVLIAWQGEVPADFLHQLEIDTEVIDYARYPVASVEEM